MSLSRYCAYKNEYDYSLTSHTQRTLNGLRATTDYDFLNCCLDYSAEVNHIISELGVILVLLLAGLDLHLSIWLGLEGA